ncbi:MAG: tRNA 2-thiocytidine biosynthesis protein TtcA [Clostridia bacterium]|nr:tRNA 2-thiocytidine biosynthesis protein TtcA [Clostridia bacterium]
MAKELTDLQKIERSITKKYRKELWNPFVTAIKRYELIQPNDRIAVCISGGKDSMLMAKLFQMLARISDVPFETVFLVMDPGYNTSNRQKIEENAARLGIPITVFSSDIFAVADYLNEKSPCYLCARMRRGHLYAKAREMHCNKIALGHHFNDVIETTLLGMFYASQLQGMIPKLHSKNFEGMELIRPLYCVHEDSIIAWARYNNLDFIRCACRFVEESRTASDGVGASKRQEIKVLLAELKKNNPLIEQSIFNSLHAVSIHTFPGLKTRQGDRSFLAFYDGENSSDILAETEREN